MSAEVLEVIHGKHTTFHVVRDRTIWSTTYLVKSTNGKEFARFDRLDRAVQWAQQKAATR